MLDLGLTDALQLTLLLKTTSISDLPKNSQDHQPHQTLRDIPCHRLIKYSTTADMATTLVCRQVDDTFGPYAQSCRGGFDFTLLFEESILSILPLGLLLTVVPFRISYLFRRTIKVDPSSWLASKLVGGPIHRCTSSCTAYWSEARD